ncbi:hypothetical protein RRF57_004453 [Xylaria bambusicola]|uniref:Uncharacterized protein n=1 Tax=Xylaria bambusicola TaxID=326684 RepID=A0AAN7UN44_9PEZI
MASLGPSSIMFRGIMNVQSRLYNTYPAHKTTTTRRPMKLAGTGGGGTKGLFAAAAICATNPYAKMAIATADPTMPTGDS